MSQNVRGYVIMIVSGAITTVFAGAVGLLSIATAQSAGHSSAVLPTGAFFGGLMMALRGVSGCLSECEGALEKRLSEERMAQLCCLGIVAFLVVSLGTMTYIYQTSRTPRIARRAALHTQP